MAQPKGPSQDRIASVKATQKITKAMQMVAAAKLRRAQEAAEAARPYSQRMAAVLANIAQASAARRSARAAGRHRQGPGASSGRLTSERGLCGGFNSQIARLARDHARKLLAPGKTVKILTVGKKGHDSCAATSATLIIEPSTCARSSASASTNAQRHRPQGHGAVRRRRVRHLHAVLHRFQSVIAQIPTAQQLIPATSARSPASAGGLRIRAGSRRRFSTTCCRATSPCRSSGRCWKMSPASWARRCPRWTTRRATPAT